MSEETNTPTEPTLNDLNAVLNALKSTIVQIDYPANYSDDLKNKLKNDFFNITVKISNHPKFPDVERFISVNKVEISFGLQSLDKRYIKMEYVTIFVKDGEDVSSEFAQYNPPILGDMGKLMMPRMMDGTPVIHYNRFVMQTPPSYDSNGTLIHEGGEQVTEELVRFPMFEVMMPMFNAPISDRDIIIAFINENDNDGFFNR